jgi:uroporphyrinogen decarboxylase
MQAYNSMQRVFAALSHKEADRVPYFLTLYLQGARELDLSIKEYFSKPEYVIEGQQRLMKKFGHDAYLGFCYAPLEIEAWGGEVIFADDGPPNSGEPLLRSPSDIRHISIPNIKTNTHLQRMLKIITGLKEIARDEVPILGVVVSPFSLPVMQMGFDKYIELIYGDRAAFWQLIHKNMQFCVEWANAQIACGATAIVYFDPVSSPTIVPKELYLETGFEIAKQTIGNIRGGVATHLASGICMPVIDEMMQTGIAGIGVSSDENLAEIKARCKGKITVLGNLNGIEMRNWTPQQAEDKVRTAIREAGAGGGFILLDNHGEIPWQVQDETLYAISDAVRTWGTYPLREDI